MHNKHSSIKRQLCTTPSAHKSVLWTLNYTSYEYIILTVQDSLKTWRMYIHNLCCCSNTLWHIFHVILMAILERKSDRTPYLTKWPTLPSPKNSLLSTGHSRPHASTRLSHDCHVMAHANNNGLVCHLWDTTHSHRDEPTTVMFTHATSGAAACFQASVHFIGVLLTTERLHTWWWHETSRLHTTNIPNKT